MTQATIENRGTTRARVARALLFAVASVGAVLATEAHAQTTPQQPPQQDPMPQQDSMPQQDPMQPPQQDPAQPMPQQPMPPQDQQPMPPQDQQQLPPQDQQQLPPQGQQQQPMPSQQPMPQPQREPAPSGAPASGAPAMDAPAGDASAQKPEQVIDPRATRALREMSDYLDGLKSASFEATSTTEVVGDNGQMLQFEATSDVAMKRPNQLRSDRKGAMTDATLAYDGKQMVVYGKNINSYATTEAPPTIDEAIEVARDDLGLEIPGADLLNSDPYQTLMKGVCAATYVGEEMLDGVKVHHLAFLGNDKDFQIWIDAGKRPLPRKFVVTEKEEKGAPDFVVEIDDWKVNPTIATNTFKFKPPKNAERIDFMQQGEELKDQP